MNGTDRWYVSGPLAVGTAFDEGTDPQASVQWAAAGTAIRHTQSDTLNLLDGRAAGLNQGPTLNWWALNAGTPPRVARLGAIGARFAATADGGSSGYLALFTKPQGGDVVEALRITERQTVGIGTVAPNARLSVVAAGGGEIGGSAHSTTFRTSAGSLGTAAGNELSLASVGFNSGNSSSLGIRALRVAAGTDWMTTAIGLGMDVDNTVRVNNSSLWFHATGSLGVGSSSPVSKLHVANNAGVLSLEGTDHVYTQFFPRGIPSGRRAYIGFGAPSSNAFTMMNESQNEPSNPSRMHLSAGEDIYLLARGGNTYISSAWGGAGNLIVQGIIRGGGDTLSVQGIVDYGQLTKLDIRDNFTAIVRCGDFTMGTTGRRGAPGRALTDLTDHLHVNFGPDWQHLQLNGHVIQSSSREQKENILDLSRSKALSILRGLNPVEFNFRFSPEKEVCLGVIAEDVPAAVGTSDRKAVSPMGLIAVLIKALQVEMDRTDDLASAFERLRAATN